MRRHRGSSHRKIEHRDWSIPLVVNGCKASSDPSVAPEVSLEFIENHDFTILRTRGFVSVTGQASVVGSLILVGQVVPRAFSEMSNPWHSSTNPSAFPKENEDDYFLFQPVTVAEGGNAWVEIDSKAMRKVPKNHDVRIAAVCASSSATPQSVGAIIRILIGY